MRNVSRIGNRVSYFPILNYPNRSKKRSWEMQEIFLALWSLVFCHLHICNHYIPFLDHMSHVTMKSGWPQRGSNRRPLNQPIKRNMRPVFQLCNNGSQMCLGEYTKRAKYTTNISQKIFSFGLKCSCCWKTYLSFRLYCPLHSVSIYLTLARISGVDTQA